VAVTRAQDRLYITGHRFSESTADCSKIGKFMTQTSCNIYQTPAPSGIALPNDPAIIEREVHWGGDIEEELQRRARPFMESGVLQSGVSCGFLGLEGSENLIHLFYESLSLFC
jgi:hypothetical protein